MLFLKKYDVYKKSSVLYETTKDPIKGNPGKEKNKAGGIPLPGLKSYYKVTLIKTAWHGQKTRHTDQWNRIERPEKKSHVYGQIFDKRTKNIQ